jgi:transcriptional regulator with XRE-family HTH domain
MTTPKISADDLFTVRNHMELTQAELAERLGVAARTIVNWEAAGVPTCRTQRVQRLLGGAIREVLDREHQVPEASRSALNQSSTTPEDRRAQLLHMFTDLDLLNELQARALRREAARAAYRPPPHT